MMAGKIPQKHDNSMFNDLILFVSFLRIFFLDSTSDHLRIRDRILKTVSCFSLSFEFGTSFLEGPCCKKNNLSLGHFCVSKIKGPPKNQSFFAQKAKHLKTN